MNGAGQSPENLQQMKKRVEQELKSDKYKSSSNKGYVFTLMPLYAIGVGVFAAYKFLKVTTYTAAPQVSDSIYSLSRHVCFCSRSGLQTTRPKKTSLQKGPKNPWRQVCVRICVCTFYLVSVVVSPSCVFAFMQRTSWTSWNKGLHRQRGCSIPSSPSWTRWPTGEWPSQSGFSRCSPHSSQTWL